MNRPRAFEAQAFRLAPERDGIAMEFGKVDGVALPGDMVSLFVGDRVVISVETARRLLIGLNEAVARHAPSLREAALKTLPPGRQAQAQTSEAARGSGSRPPEPDMSGTQAAHLLRAIGDWGVAHVYEQSARLTGNSIQSTRFLVTVAANDIPGEKLANVLAICDSFAIPGRLREAAAGHFAAAKCVHFGFEGDAGGIVVKLYLERLISSDEIEQARAANAPVPLHLAFKWDPAVGTGVTTRYLWYPGLTAAGIEARLAGIYRTGAAKSHALALAVARLARRPERLRYLEVEEAENARRSFDLNLYDEGMKVQDIAEPLHGMRSHFGIRPGRFQLWYDQVAALSLGHLAGGIHRNSEDFFNLYYGAAALPPTRQGPG
jgi:hypothetical protein